MRQEEILSLKKAPDAADLLKRASATQTDDLNATTGVRVVDSARLGIWMRVLFGGRFSFAMPRPLAK